MEGVSVGAINRLLAIAPRDGEHADPPGPGWAWTHVPVPRLEISSSDIRTRLAEGRPVDGLLPGATLAYIREHDLYTAR